MLTNNEHITISKEIDSKNELDFSFLRATGIAYLEKFSGKLWTDFNGHDPGITLLELLSYAISDLGARINLPIEDILTNNEDANLKQFFEAHEILSSHPVTTNDYRKLFIDVSGVRNAWMLKYDQCVYIDCENNALSYKPFNLPADKQHCFKVKGLYKIILDFDEFSKTEYPTDLAINQRKEQIIKEVECLYHNNRNLCEDLVDIGEVDEQKIAVCMHVEVQPEADEELVNAKIIYAIKNYFSPQVRFHTLQEMLDSGTTTDEIFNGPVLQHGFIKDEDLSSAKLRKEVRLSDLIQIVSNIEGVKIIKDISINKCDDKVDSDADGWTICMKNGHKPVLCNKSSYSFFKDVLPLNINQKQVENYLEILYNDDLVEEQMLLNAEKKLKIRKGLHSRLDEYASVVHDLPLVYGVGEVGLPRSASEARKAQAKQLKSYMLFFDQILANYMKHLHGVKELLAINTDFASTVFAQQVKDLPNIEDLVHSDYHDNTDHAFVEWLYGDIANSKEKVNQILNHLLARFSENFGKYAFLMKQLYGDSAKDQVIESKIKFVQSYDELSYKRGLGFNYCCSKEALWNSTNVSAFEKRIALLTGISDYSRRNLSHDLLEFYNELDDEGHNQLRWRIRNAKGVILISATKFYSTDEEMLTEILLVKHLGSKTENYEVRKAVNDMYYIVLVDLSKPKKSEEYVIARRFAYYKTIESANKMIVKLAKEIKASAQNEGLFLIENLLLLPELKNLELTPDFFMPVCTENCQSCEEVDPYSYRVTIVLPGWTERFSNMDFRNYMELLIRSELPAHVMARICWVGYPANSEEIENDMLDLEKAYKEFLEQKQVLCETKADGKLKNLIQAIGNLNTIYPKGRLINCEDESDNLDGKVILGRTKI